MVLLRRGRPATTATRPSETSTQLDAEPDVLGLAVLKPGIHVPMVRIVAIVVLAVAPSDPSDYGDRGSAVTARLGRLHR